MKRRIIIVSSVIIVSLLAAGMVYAFTADNLDGVWGEIDVYSQEGTDTIEQVDGADCNTYATGGDDTLDGVPTTIATSWWNQSGPNDDWNQVRYGIGEGYSTCGDTPFSAQSGLGFDGINGLSSIDYKAPFVLGTFCHYNNPIYSPDNALDYVALNVTMSGIGCEPPLVSAPSNPDEIAFNYIFNLIETTNSGECEYETDPLGNPCADVIFVSQDPDPSFFTCMSSGDPNISVEYTVIILGFMAKVQDAQNGWVCPDWNAEDALGAFISNEGSSNCSCMYGQVDDYVPTAVDLISFKAKGTQDGIMLEWRTSNEVDNMGFNLYRAVSKEGDKTKLNESLIPTNLMPGSLEGAFYSYEDLSVEDGVTYYYWLQDVDAFGRATIHGPVEGIK